MATATQREQTTQRQKSGEQLPVLAHPRLPYHPQIEQRFGIDKSQWIALIDAIFPGATRTESIILALSYCRARKLDPFKRNVHIVPIWNKDRGGLVDTVWPGIGELRTTAFRTGEYAGCGETVFGDDVTQMFAFGDGEMEVTYPEWAQVTVRRVVKGHIVDFAGPKVYWLETYATVRHDSDAPNSMWQTRPRGQLEKCAEAAALRRAFPEEVGSDYIPEEVQHRGPSIDATSITPAKVEQLEQLTEKLEKESTAESSGESQESPEAAIEAAYNAFCAELDATQAVTEANAVHEKHFGPDRQVDWPSHIADMASKRLTEHVGNMKSNRGAGSNKQKELVK